MNKLFHPRVTIIIPVYNGSNFVVDAVESALNQTYDNVEVIVVNDGSKDNTEEVLQKYMPKIKYFKKENGGVSSALNLGIENMTGTYFSWLSHDDVYMPEKIEKQIEFLSKLDDQNVILYCDYALMDIKGKKYPKDYILDHAMLEKKPEYVLLRGCISGITLLIPKQAFTDCGLFDLEYRCIQDYDMWARMYKKYKFIHMPVVITKTRIHPNQDTQKNPKVISEGNILWKDLIEFVSDKRKIELEGSLFNYYYEFALYFRNTMYTEMMQYCIDKCISIDKEAYYQKDIMKLKGENAFQKILRHIKSDGLLTSVRLIIARIKRKK